MSFSKGDWTNCRYDICEIVKDGDVFCTVATDDVDLVISVLEENEQLKSENKGIQNKVWRLLELLEKEKGIDKKKIIDWWNGDVE